MFRIAVDFGTCLASGVTWIDQTLTPGQDYYYFGKVRIFGGKRPWHIQKWELLSDAGNQLITDI
ncbi:MAG: hypothetical protein IPO94_19625 [Saprospiraceae bacterium]|nr:hypothetical protein [Saprospiraceae bacterium]